MTIMMMIMTKCAKPPITTTTSVLYIAVQYEYSFVIDTATHRHVCHKNLKFVHKHRFHPKRSPLHSSRSFVRPFNTYTEDCHKTIPWIPTTISIIPTIPRPSLITTYSNTDPHNQLTRPPNQYIVYKKYKKHTTITNKKFSPSHSVGWPQRQR